MTITTTTNEATYTGNGVTKAFTVPFKFLDKDDVKVYLVNNSTGNTVLQSRTSDYSLTAPGDSGTVTFSDAPPSTRSVFIKREIPATQEVDYISGDSFPAETHEGALDKLTMLIQQNTSAVGRSLRFTEGDVIKGADGELPSVSGSEGKYLKLTGDGNGIEYGSGIEGWKSTDDIDYVNGVSVLRTMTPVDGQPVWLLRDGDRFPYKGVEGGTHADDGMMTIVPTGGDGSSAFALDRPQSKYFIHPNNTVDQIKAVIELCVSDGNTSNRIVFLPGHYTIGSTVEFDVPEDTIVIAYGATFTCTSDSVAFDLNPSVTAAIPINVSSSSYTKRRIRWCGGHFINTNVSKTASVGIQSLYMRDFSITGAYFTGFWRGHTWNGKDTYRFYNNYYYDNTIGAEMIDGVLGESGGTPNTSDVCLDTVFRDCHFSCSGKEAGVRVSNRFRGFKFLGGSFNGATTSYQLDINVGGVAVATPSSGLNITGTHFEQGDKILRVAQQGGEIRGSEIGGGVELFASRNGSSALHPILIDECVGITLTAGNITGGGTTAGDKMITFGSACKAVTIRKEMDFQVANASHWIDYACDRDEITLEPEIRPYISQSISAGSYPSGSTWSSGSQVLDMSSEWGGFGLLPLPPKGYHLSLAAYDPGSAASTSNVQARIGTGDTATSQTEHITVSLDGVPNNQIRTSHGLIKADDAGDIKLYTTASGANTLRVYYFVKGVVM